MGLQQSVKGVLQEIAVWPKHYNASAAVQVLCDFIFLCLGLFSPFEGHRILRQLGSTAACWRVQHYKAENCRPLPLPA